jgi:peptidoglycan/xylan/chitin deacetylase (PgdA/CDA1 family)
LNPIEFLWKRIKKLYRMIQWNHEEIMRWVQEAVRRCRNEFWWYDIWNTIS